MVSKFDVELTKQDYVSGLSTVMVQLGLRDNGRHRRILLQIVLSTVVLIAMMTLFWNDALAVLVAFFVAAAVDNWLIRWTGRRATGASYDPATAAFSVEFGPAGIVERAPSRVREWQWPAVRQVHDTGSVIVFELDGWDMLVLPYRQWPSESERLEFLRWSRAQLRAPLAAESKPPETIGDLFGRDHLFVGALAAGVDVMFVALYFVPAAYADTGIWITLAGLLLAAAAGYAAYRIARRLLPRLYARAPQPAMWLGHLLIAALPIYILLSYLSAP